MALWWGSNDDSTRQDLIHVSLDSNIKFVQHIRMPRRILFRYWFIYERLENPLQQLRSIFNLNTRCILYWWTDLTDGTGLQGRTYCPVGKLFPLVEVAIFDSNLSTKLTGEPGEVSSREWLYRFTCRAFIIRGNNFIIFSVSNLF